MTANKNRLLIDELKMQVLVSKLDMKLPFGCQVSGISLSEDVKSDIDMIKKCLSDHKLVFIRNQQTLAEDRQVQISRWFGDLENAGFECHAKSKSDFVLRLSNDPAEGLQNFGTSGFHIDCSFLPNPSSVSVYHMIQASKDGDTGTNMLLWAALSLSLCLSLSLI